MLFILLDLIHDGDLFGIQENWLLCIGLYSRVYSLNCVSKTKSISSIIFCAMSGAVCPSLLIYLDDCDCISASSYYLHYIGNTANKPLFIFWSWNSNVLRMPLQ